MASIRPDSPLFPRLPVVVWIAARSPCLRAIPGYSGIFRPSQTACLCGVVFLADDHGWLDNSVFGDGEVKTPTLARLAKEGMAFPNAFVASPACGPSRASLLSGLMPARHGAEPNHTEPKPRTLTMIHALKARGYEVAAFGKVGHDKSYMKPAGFDIVENGRKDQIGKQVEKFLKTRDRGKPLCLFVGDHRPHVKWTPKPRYDPATVSLPRHFVDTPETRTHRARYYSDITGMDQLIGEVDRMTHEHFGSDDFLFLYSSDHGAQWPFGKWNLYDAGTRTPLLVRWPGTVKSGSRPQAMVSWVDILPTLIDVAGGKVPDGIDGSSFAKVLRGESSEHRDLVFTTHTGDGSMNVYPIRAVRDQRFKYIRNLRPDCYHSNHSDIQRLDGAGGYWDSWAAAAKTDPKAAAIVRRYHQRPAVEFFDLQSDPLEQNNLADDPAHRDRINTMSAKLDEWIKQQGDTGKLHQEPYPLTGPTPHEIFLKSDHSSKKPARKADTAVE